jgi:PAS domain S-box-containing protein
MQKKTAQNLSAENAELRARLEELQETLDAIRRGEVDGLVVPTPKGEQVFTLSGAEKPYRVLIEEMREGAVMLSDKNAILYCNSGFAKMVKRPMEKIVGNNIEAMICPTHRSAFNKLLRSARSSEEAITKETTLQAEDGTLVPSNISINTMQMENAATTFLVVTNLTEHMEVEVKRYTTELELAQIALSESEQRWATTLESIGDAVISTDGLGKITFMNSTAEELTGWTLKETKQRPAHDIFKIINQETRKKVQDPIANVLSKGVVVGLANHTILVRKNGTEVPIDDSGAPIKSKEDKITGVVLIFRDTTERNQMEAKLEEYRKHLENLVEDRTKQLKDAERLAAIGQTAGMVGHDIRNPLQSILSELYLAKAELSTIIEEETKENLLENITNVEDEINYINKIVQDLQDFARTIKPIAQEIDLQTICEEILLKNSIPKNIKATCKIQPEAKKIMADPDALKRIVGNLVTNAVQAMPKGGQLTIKANLDKDITIITVQDTGIGIPENVKKKLFTPLFTTKAKGQGFGLPVVKRMTEALGGKVDFESEVGKGTTFTVRLPSPRN